MPFRRLSWIICVPLEAGRMGPLGLHPMVNPIQDPMKTAWTVSVDAKDGVTTGISAPIVLTSISLIMRTP